MNKVEDKDEPTEMDSHGNRYWRNDKGLYHRIDGPAREYANGSKEWYIHGERHRIDGPACEWSDGDKWWYLNGKRHRTDGPAIEEPNRRRCWYINGIETTKISDFLKGVCNG